MESKRKVQQPGDELVGSLLVGRLLLLMRRRKDLSEAELLLSRHLASPSSLLQSWVKKAEFILDEKPGRNADSVTSSLTSQSVKNSFTRLEPGAPHRNLLKPFEFCCFDVQVSISDGFLSSLHLRSI